MPTRVNVMCVVSVLVLWVSRRILSLSEIERVSAFVFFVFVRCWGWFVFVAVGRVVVSYLYD